MLVLGLCVKSWKYNNKNNSRPCFKGYFILAGGNRHWTNSTGWKFIVSPLCWTWPHAGTSPELLTHEGRKQRTSLSYTHVPPGSDTWSRWWRGSGYKICQGTILILLNKSYLRNSWYRKDTLTLLSVPLKSGNASPCEMYPFLQGSRVGGWVERHPYHQRERIQGQEVYLNKLWSVPSLINIWVKVSSSCQFLINALFLCLKGI